MAMSDYNKLVVFDCDGTLVDSQHMIMSAMHAAYDRLGLPRENDLAIRATVGLSPIEIMKILRPNDDDEFHLEMTKAFKESFYHLRVTMAAEPDPLYLGTRSALEELRDEGYLLGVATGNSNRGLARVIQEHNLDGFFVTLQTADNHPSKPHPSMMHTAIADAGSHEALTVMVGDTSFDMKMARAAGCHAVGVRWGYHDTATLQGGGAHHIIDVYDELVPLIGQLGR